jgi:hypothetical protein
MAHGSSRVAIGAHKRSPPNRFTIPSQQEALLCPVSSLEGGR